MRPWSLAYLQRRSLYMVSSSLGFANPNAMAQILLLVNLRSPTLQTPELAPPCTHRTLRMCHHSSTWHFPSDSVSSLHGAWRGLGCKLSCLPCLKDSASRFGNLVLILESSSSLPLDNAACRQWSAPSS